MNPNVLVTCHRSQARPEPGRRTQRKCGSKNFKMQEKTKDRNPKYRRKHRRKDARARGSRERHSLLIRYIGSIFKYCPKLSQTKLNNQRTAQHDCYESTRRSAHQPTSRPNHGQDFSAVLQTIRLDSVRTQPPATTAFQYPF